MQSIILGSQLYYKLLWATDYVSSILRRLPPVKWICASESWANGVLRCCLSGECELAALVSSVATGVLSACSLPMNSTQSIAWLLPCLEFPPPNKLNHYFLLSQTKFSGNRQNGVRTWMASAFLKSPGSPLKPRKSRVHCLHFSRSSCLPHFC